MGGEYAKWTTIHFQKDSSACKMVLLKRVSPGYLRVWLKINKEIPGFSDAGGREASVRGQDAKSKINVIGRSEKPNKDTTGFWEESVYFAKKPSFMHFFFFFFFTGNFGMWDPGSKGAGGRMTVGEGAAEREGGGRLVCSISPWGGECFICTLLEFLK